MLFAKLFLKKNSQSSTCKDIKTQNTSKSIDGYVQNIHKLYAYKLDFKR